MNGAEIPAGAFEFMHKVMLFKESVASCAIEAPVSKEAKIKAAMAIFGEPRDIAELLVEGLEEAE